MPYKGVDSQCQLTFDWQDHLHYIDNYFKISPQTTDAYKQALIDFGPLTAGIATSDLFIFYIGGAYDDPSGPSALNHVVVLTGWDSDGWIIKNSWGTDWGESGYAHIAFGGIEEYNYVYSCAIDDVGVENSSWGAIKGIGR